MWSHYNMLRNSHIFCNKNSHNLLHKIAYRMKLTSCESCFLQLLRKIHPRTLSRNILETKPQALKQLLAFRKLSRRKPLNLVFLFSLQLTISRPYKLNKPFVLLALLWIVSDVADSNFNQNSAQLNWIRRLMF